MFPLIVSQMDSTCEVEPILTLSFFFFFPPLKGAKGDDSSIIPHIRINLGVNPKVATNTDNYFSPFTFSYSSDDSQSSDE